MGTYVWTHQLQIYDVHADTYWQRKIHGTDYMSLLISDNPVITNSGQKWAARSPNVPAHRSSLWCKYRRQRCCNHLTQYAHTDNSIYESYCHETRDRKMVENNNDAAVDISRDWRTISAHEHHSDNQGEISLSAREANIILHHVLLWSVRRDERRSIWTTTGKYEKGKQVQWESYISNDDPRKVRASIAQTFVCYPQPARMLILTM